MIHKARLHKCLSVSQCSHLTPPSPMLNATPPTHKYTHRHTHTPLPTITPFLTPLSLLPIPLLAFNSTFPPFSSFLNHPHHLHVNCLYIFFYMMHQQHWLSKQRKRAGVTATASPVSSATTSFLTQPSKKKCFNSSLRISIAAVSLKKSKGTLQVLWYRDKFFCALKRQPLCLSMLLGW